MGGTMVDLSFSMQDFEYFMLIVVRTSGFLFTAPIYNAQSIPKITKVGLAVFISYILYYSIQPKVWVEYSTVLGYAVIVMKELLTGILIGFSVNICTYIIAFGGRIVDMEIGLSMVSQLDPATRENATFTGLLYQYSFMLIMLVTGMYRFFLEAFIETYELIPVNGAVFHVPKLLDAILQFMGRFVLIGFQIALPVFIVMMLLNAILGILAKVAPQLNMFTVGIQLKILVGLSVIMLTTILIPNIADFIFTEMRRMMVLFVEGMM